MQPKREPKSAKDILTSHDFLGRIQHSAKYISKEFQDYGLRLATNLGDLQHKALYIKLAKEVPRNKLEAAASFALDYPTSGKNKGKIFMWKLRQICKFRFPAKKKAVKKKVRPGPKPKKHTNQLNFL